jgi:predicted dithiol-disulfide oxidoreductase (DUF899 family)
MPPSGPMVVGVGQGVDGVHARRQTGLIGNHETTDDGSARNENRRSRLRRQHPADPHCVREKGLSVFLRDGKKVYRTYFTNGRAVETLGTPWTFLDLTPLGRQETWEDSPKGWPQTPPYQWWRRHDEYHA